MKKHISYSELKTWAECPYKSESCLIKTESRNLQAMPLQRSEERFTFYVRISSMTKLKTPKTFLIFHSRKNFKMLELKKMILSRA